MKFSKMCGPLQVYVLLCLISLILQVHVMYTNSSWKKIYNQKLNIITSLIFNFVIFVFWGKILNSLCMTNNNTIAWMLIFAPIIFGMVSVVLVMGIDTVKNIENRM